MIQEEASRRGVNMAIKLEKVSAKLIMKAISHRIKKHKEKVERSGGKVSVKNLISSGRGISSVPVGEAEDMKDFKRFTKKYNIKYSIKKDAAGKYVTFIRSPDLSTLDMFYRSFMQNNYKKKSEQKRESVHTRTRKAQEQSLKREQSRGKEVKTKTQVKSKEKVLER